MVNVNTSMSLSDRLEILDLYARYTHCIDSGKIDAWCECFIPSGSLEIPSRSTATRGRSELEAFALSHVQKVQGREKHVTTNISLESAGDGRAHGRAYLMMVVGDRDSAHIRALGEYEDELVFTESGWLFEKRVLGFRSSE